MTTKHLTEKFYSSINLVVNKTQPKKILFLSKVFCEEWLLSSMVTYSNNIHIDYLLIQEDELLNLECKVKDDNKYNFPHHYLSFEEFKKFSFLDSYDFIIMDTVHYKDYMDYIFKQIIPLCNGYVLLHDTLPQSEGTMTVSRRINNEPWVGETYISFHNFHIANKEITFNFDDKNVGYGLIDCTKNNINVNYDDSIMWSLNDIKLYSKPHEQFGIIFN
jgi:hypothetical protein